MANEKFTKGPWEAGRKDMATLVEGIPSKCIYAGDSYCAIASGAGTEDWYEIMANAYLIAAAPELYAMLEELLNEAEDFRKRSGKEVTWEDEARQLLAKARGEEL